MLTNDNNRSGLLSAGGILSIVAGIFQIISGGVLIVDFLVSYQHGFGLTKWFLLPFFPDAWRHYILWGSGAIPASMNYVPIRWAIIGGCLGVLGIVAVVGGVSAIRRKSFGLSLAGAICALLSGLLGILAVIFVSLSKREFGAERKEMALTSNHRRWLLSAGGVISIVAGVLEVIEGSSVLTIQIYGRFFVILGVLAIVGGISALRRKSFGLSLAGAICALPLYSFLQPLGMLAVIFVALGKGEFGAERKEMASTGSGRDGLLSAGGILSIVAGITQIISAVSMAVFFLISSNLNHILWARWFFLPLLPEAWVDNILLEDYWVIHCQGYRIIPIWWVIIGGVVGVLGILAIVGGVSAIRRKRFGLSLAGAICALLSGLLGVLAVIFVALGKREFGAKA